MIDDGQVPSSAPRLSGAGSSAPDFKEQPAPDVVFIVREQVRRPELQFALRSWSMVPHGTVWMVGGCPSWVRNVRHVPFPDGVDKWRNISDKFRSLAELDDLSDWFYYTEDDYHILEPVDEIPLYRHHVPLRPRVEEYRARRKREPRGGWEGYLAATLRVLEGAGVSEPESFDVHIPMLVEKARIPTHLKTPDAVSWRDLYGNLSGRDPVTIDIDVKTGSAGSLLKKAKTGFLSTSEGTFRRSGAEALLSRLFPISCVYEKEGLEMAEYVKSERREQWRKDRLVRRVTRSGETLVRTDAGWVPEQFSEGSGGVPSSDVPLSGASDPSDLVCDVCSFEAASAAGLGAHKRAKHPVEG